MRTFTRASHAAFLAVAAAARGADLAVPQAEFFENKIRPLLVERCYECHSAEKKQKGGLLLDTREGTLKGGDTGPAVVEGDASKSLLITAVKWTDKDLQMPPKKQLSAEEIAVLEEWVKMGAPDPRTGARTLTKIEQHLEDSKKHWAFQPVPPLKSESLDSLAPGKSAPADQRILIRRAYLDLIGVPPSYTEVDAFVADSSPKAFEVLVDRLLADSRYGERWGRHWLDVARYADNMGSIFNGDDTYPNAWTYRDYVIKAFNDDKPYDRFILEQIAADQLGTAKDIGTLAGMGFLGLGTRKDRRLDDDTLDDTIDVIGRGLMGMTIGCARCHDHKLEPITTKDYYGLYAVLKSSKEPDDAPALPQADSPEVQEFRAKNLQLRTDYATASIKGASAAIHAARSRLGDYLAMAGESGWKGQNENKKVPDWCLKRDLNAAVHGYVVGSRKAWIEAHPEVFGPFIEFITKMKLTPAPTLHPLIAKAFAEPAASLEEIAKRYNEVFAAVDSAWRELAKAEIEKPAQLNSEEIDFVIADKFVSMDKLQPRFFDRLDALETKMTLPDADHESLRQILIAKGSGMKFSTKAMRTSRILPKDDGSGKIFNAFELLGKTHPGAPVRAMTFVDAEKMYDGKVFVRGNPNTKGPDAPRQFLTVLRHVSPEPFPKDKSGRLELAKAIVSKDNPLTARVIVNRVWAWHFGTPLIGTPSDFGFRGDRPANQPLLDHLAAWFMENGWSFKKLHRHIMLNPAYQRADFPMQPLELEPFRDSLLAVSGRLKPEIFGKPEKTADNTRRTIYGFVDRKALPSLYRSFDFPNPSFSAPQRSRTALAPRALILMNSPLVTESAKSLAESLTKELSDEAARITELYRRVLQRQPSGREMQRAREYLAAYPLNDRVHPESGDWQYGYGAFDSAAKQVRNFSKLSAFDGKSFKGTLKTTDGKPSEIKVDAMGGDPGVTAALSSIRRWVSPLDGEIHITAELTHTEAKTEGVVARIISSRSGELGEWKAKAQSLCTDLAKVAVKKGDALDFIVSSQSDKDGGPYQWSPSITVPGSSMPGMPGMAQRWDARVDFADPSKPLKPLTALEELCQAVLLSPEFAVLE